MIDKIETILHFWFGNAEKSVLPSEHRLWVWFSADSSLCAELKENFEEDVLKAEAGEYDNWLNTARGSLALLILLDQFSRLLYKNTPRAFAQDTQALKVCLSSIERSHDHQLSLIERLFFYFPLMNAENLEMQTLSIRAYQMLNSIAFSETKPFFDRFLEFAQRHYDCIVEFGRFPSKNVILGRPSTEAELAFLEKMHGV